ncbi:unnamed protein product [Pedinophyceae sp. YPF-701]|nr:unnamed protein product [Pedinophyceae sp. YPF-701]
MVLNVLHVAEKPSLAQSIANFLCEGGAQVSTRRASPCDVHVVQSKFLGQPAEFRVTSVVGHVFSIDFTKEYQSWEKTDPTTLFAAETVRSEANPKARVVEHIKREARGCQHLVLWLDCDREGENICFEVMSVAVPVMSTAGGGRRVHRARFSAVSRPEIQHAMKNLGEPNRNESLSVDARQELDLKVGVAFTRFQTRYLQGKYGNLDASVVSYGPCQTPTLNFAVERQQLIAQFHPEPFWSVRPRLFKNKAIALEWARGRVFDKRTAELFHSLVAVAGTARVTSVTDKDLRRARPHGLNTVGLLMVASQKLGMGPHHAMQVAERLYISGYLSYPRTESTGYPAHFDFREIVAGQTRNDALAAYARSVLDVGVTRPKGGKDVGDHPPITPVRGASEGELTGDMWRMYDYVSRHFFASIAPDCVLKRTTAIFAAGGEEFKATGTVVVKPGWTAVLPRGSVSRAPKDQDREYAEDEDDEDDEDEDEQETALPPLSKGEELPLTEVALHQGQTSPPGALTEAELIHLMEKNGIGTDASIPTHINNICERNYVRVETGRRIVPTELGMTLVRGYNIIDPDLCRPEVRAEIEKNIALVAAGAADKESVVQHALDQFRQKFLYFVSKIQKMDALFEASFSPLASSGKPLSRCGKCLRYMRYMSARPARLHCATCEDIYHVPQGGAVKLYKGLTCPLDGFELVIFRLGGADGKSQILCPMCYNHPPFEDAVVGTGTMMCGACSHPTCPHSLPGRGATTCPECDAGTLVLDPASGPKWRLDCNRCAFLLYLPPDLHMAEVARERCEDCGSKMMSLDWKKGKVPAAWGSEDGAETRHTVCIVCDDDAAELCEAKASAKVWVRRGGRGRGRGRRGRGRGRGRNVDPRMTFDGF